MITIIFQFVATGIVFNSQKKVLMIKHKELNMWLPPGGHIETNETPDMAVIREIYEETGIFASIVGKKNEIATNEEGCVALKTPILVLLEDIHGNEEPHKHIDLIYVCQAKNGTLSPNYAEVDDVGWFDISDLENLHPPPNVVKSVEFAFGYLKNNLGID